jgi:hypothetical protein
MLIPVEIIIKEYDYPNLFLLYEFCLFWDRD